MDVSGGSITNSGTISYKDTRPPGRGEQRLHGYGIAINGIAPNFDIINNSGAIIEGFATFQGTGVLVREGKELGNTINSGLITSTSLTNSSGYQLEPNGKAGTLVNTIEGEIIAYGAGSLAAGIYLARDSEMGTISNAGKIIGLDGPLDGPPGDTHATEGIGIYLYHEATVNGNITNSGTIEGAGTLGNRGITINFNSKITGSIINQRGGTIKASVPPGGPPGEKWAYGISLRGGPCGICVPTMENLVHKHTEVVGAIINYGTISGSGPGGTGIRINQSAVSGGIVNHAGGEITGDEYGIHIIKPTFVGGISGELSITNEGTISSINTNTDLLHLSGDGNTGPVTGDITNSSLKIFNSFTSGGAINGFASITVDDGATFNQRHNITATAFTVGEGASGTLNVAGNTVTTSGTFNMAAGSSFNTTINTATADDAGKLIAAGTATIPAGTTVNINTGAVTLVAGTSYKIVDGDGSVGVNVPTTIVDNNASFNFVGSVDDGDLIVTVEAAPEPPPMDDPPPAMDDPPPPMDDPPPAMDDPPPAETPVPINITSMNGAAQSATSSAQKYAVGTIVKRLTRVRTESGSGITGLAPGDGYSQSEKSLWLQAYGSSIDQDERQGINGFDADTSGITIGADGLATEDLRLGFAFSYSDTEVNTKGIAYQNSIDSYQASGYSSYQMGDYYINAIATYASNKYMAARHLVVGPLSRSASSEYDADQFGLRTTIGRNFQFQEIEVTPYFSLDYVRLKTDGYTETGAGAANLTVNSNDSDALESTLGVSVGKQMKTSGGARFKPEASIAWQHLHNGENLTSTANFSGGGGSFISTGFEPATDGIKVGLSMAIYNAGGLEFKMEYDYEAKEDYEGHFGRVTLSYTYD